MKLPDNLGFLKSRSVQVLSLLLGLQALLVYDLAWKDELPNPPGLRAIPAKIGDWTLAGEAVMDKDTLDYLKPEEYFFRTYVSPASQGAIELFIAYFSSLNSGLGPHAPKHCLPGAGWAIRTGEEVRIEVPGQAGGIPANQYVLEKDRAKILVLYWYQNKRHVYAAEAMAKIYALPELIRYRRSDVALVRVITPLDANGLNPTKERTLDFIRALFPEVAAKFAAT